MVPLDQEVLVLEGEVVASIRALAARGVGSKRIAAALDVARNTVKRYVRTTVPAGVQVRSQARCSSEEARAEARRVSEVATVRVETAPGEQLQVDLGRKRASIAGTAVRIDLLVAVFGYSRRIFAEAFLYECQDERRDGLAAAFQHFGGRDPHRAGR